MRKVQREYPRLLREANGVVRRIVVATPDHELCETAECFRDVEALCDFPVKDGDRYWWCNRRLCESCATEMGTGQKFCPPHARAVKANPDLFVTVCAACGSPSCAQKEAGFTCAARDETKLRIVPQQIWTAHLMFAHVKW
jgi:hypothetical protein